MRKAKTQIPGVITGYAKVLVYICVLSPLVVFAQSNCESTFNKKQDLLIIDVLDNASLKEIKKLSSTVDTSLIIKLIELNILSQMANKKTSYAAPKLISHSLKTTMVDLDLDAQRAMKLSVLSLINQATRKILKSPKANELIKRIRERESLTESKNRLIHHEFSELKTLSSEKFGGKAVNVVLTKTRSSIVIDGIEINLAKIKRFIEDNQFYKSSDVLRVSETEFFVVSERNFVEHWQFDQLTKSWEPSGVLELVNEQGELFSSYKRLNRLHPIDSKSFLAGSETGSFVYYEYDSAVNKWKAVSQLGESKTSTSYDWHRDAGVSVKSSMSFEKDELLFSRDSDGKLVISQFDHNVRAFVPSASRLISEIKNGGDSQQLLPIGNNQFVTSNYLKVILWRFNSKSGEVEFQQELSKDEVFVERTGARPYESTDTVSYDVRTMVFENGRLYMHEKTGNVSVWERADDSLLKPIFVSDVNTYRAVKHINSHSGRYDYIIPLAGNHFGTIGHDFVSQGAYFSNPKLLIWNFSNTREPIRSYKIGESSNSIDAFSFRSGESSLEIKTDRGEMYGLEIKEMNISSE